MPTKRNSNISSIVGDVPPRNFSRRDRDTSTLRAPAATNIAVIADLKALEILGISTSNCSSTTIDSPMMERGHPLRSYPVTFKVGKPVSVLSEGQAWDAGDEVEFIDAPGTLMAKQAHTVPPGESRSVRVEALRRHVQDARLTEVLQTAIKRQDRLIRQSKRKERLEAEKARFKLMSRIALTKAAPVDIVHLLTRNLTEREELLIKALRSKSDRDEATEVFVPKLKIAPTDDDLNRGKPCPSGVKLMHYVRRSGRALSAEAMSEETKKLKHFVPGSLALSRAVTETGRVPNMMRKQVPDLRKTKSSLDVLDNFRLSVFE